MNASGTQDAGEPNLENWAFSLHSGTSCAGAPLLSGTTDSLGKLLFQNLAAGNYSVLETLQAGWQATTPICQSVTLNEGVVAQLNFGNQLIPIVLGEKIVAAGQADVLPATGALGTQPLLLAALALVVGGIFLSYFGNPGIASAFASAWYRPKRRERLLD